MSFFPSPDFEEMQSLPDTFTQPSPQLRPSPPYSEPDKLTESFTDPTGTNDYLLSDLHSPSTTAAEACGLVTMSFSTSGTYLTALAGTPLEQILSTSMPWSQGAYATSHLGTQQYPLFRSDYYGWESNGYNVPTVRPESTWIGPPNTGTVSSVCDASASLSPYSTHSSPSALSTPDSQCGDFANIRGAPSPPVKIEDAGETEAIPGHRVGPDSTLVVRPRDILAHPLQDAHDDAVAADDTSEAQYNMKSEYSDVSIKQDDEYEPECERASPQSQREHELDTRSADALEPTKQPKRVYGRPTSARCSCKLCGKHFQRIYNLRAHMDTHDPEREHPHACDWPQCPKRFVRKADLVRHEQSVHLKTRDFECPFCNAKFARKDTLIRHCDDGCLRRPEYRTRILRTRRTSKTIHRRSIIAPLILNDVENDNRAHDTGTLSSRS